MADIDVIGGGLSGSEAAWQLAEAGHRVRLHEMRPTRTTAAHRTDGLAELVCSNSFRSDDAETNAVGLLHAELRDLGSLIMRAADAHQVPAGGALAVDREAFSAAVGAAIAGHPNITVVREEIAALPDGAAIVATGPLTSDALAAAITVRTGAHSLAFFDAIAPIVYRDTVDMDVAWFQSRYDKPGPGGTGADYLNCPMDRDTYEAFIDALLSADRVSFKDFEDTPYFDGCLPIEVMAERGRETLRHGPMKPLGLTNAHAPTVKPYAVVQLRQDNALGTLFNMVGFQTKLRYGAQADVFRMIPGLQGAEFARLGGLHRNTYIDGPRLLDPTLRLTVAPNLRFAGQITGCEGYVEATATGLLAGRFYGGELSGRPFAPPPPTTAMGALLGHITGGHLSADAAEGRPRSYQPMNINFGLFPPFEEPVRLRGRRAEKKAQRKAMWTTRARADFAAWQAEGRVGA
ncbi:methylenetetrahydrofolate--tRNA-(uracil(54)-C(5))-methyltransferase (FADH(2)-oxidizing) TrmFO [Acuticoccus mangrovi]|uniref:Methylenetetrahydrofolate--tRNA-(uracil-5-)-methyltransferase TrmFO n=1 Tax=Acuticoccus mangrovi TaxID=2796142 RepID=A0A934IEU4_9HYPH|nr:methylenetetrahydrofolate--tRNA-(uracil(54)-C(5))-methyltransferase (FADH(2)-oxidizing) TrmFO [Acuticoccus mangrovi]MBJ3775233.1 methylenetetrahydrofolate--tRNA-(uracil(54)-C(5))-methyltransferase (FADH(2)-oxidizing) TrmFO [Acuticoccus mangrovi]